MYLVAEDTPTSANLPKVDVAESARLRLATALSVEPGDISVGASRGITFSDSSIGLTERGLGQASSVMTPGFILTLSHQSDRYEYRANNRRPLHGKLVAVPDHAPVYWKQDPRGIYITDW